MSVHTPITHFWQLYWIFFSLSFCSYLAQSPQTIKIYKFFMKTFIIPHEGSLGHVENNFDKSNKIFGVKVRSFNEFFKNILKNFLPKKYFSDCTSDPVAGSFNNRP